MNYIKEAEQRLKYYGDLYKSIEHMNREISRLIYQAGPKSNSKSIVDITKIPDSAKDETYNILFKIQTLVNSKTKTEKELEKIDSVLRDISQDEGCEYYGEVLRKWYIERVPKEYIAHDIGYSSRRSIYTVRAKAIRKFAVRLFGLNALKII